MTGPELVPSGDPRPGASLGFDLDPADRVAVVPGPHVDPQPIPQPARWRIFWPDVALSDEAVKANVGRTIKVNYGEGTERRFAYEARIVGIVPGDGGMQVTLERIDT